jgi:hypothetical protein
MKTNPILFTFRIQGYHAETRHKRLIELLERGTDKCIRLADNCYLIRSYGDFSSFSANFVGDVVLTTEDEYYAIPVTGPIIGAMPPKIVAWLDQQEIAAMHTPAVLRHETKE